MREGTPRFVVGARAVIALVAGLAGCASDPLVVVDAAVFAPSIDGKLGLSDSVATDADPVDLDSNLGVDDTDYVPYGRAEADFGLLNLAASAFTTSQSGTGTVTADFGDIASGSTVDTDLDLILAHARLVADFLDTDVVKLGLGLGADWIDLDLDAQELSFGITEHVDVKQLVPLLEVHGAVQLPLQVVDLRLDLNVGGMALDFGDIDGTVLDVEAILRGEFEHFGVFGGYRFVMIDAKGEADDQNFDGDLDLAGWMLGVSVRF
jgi:hypothetical protein